MTCMFRAVLRSAVMASVGALACSEPSLVRVLLAPPAAGDTACLGPGGVGTNADALLYEPGPRCVVFSAIQIRDTADVRSVVVRTRGVVRETAPGAVPCLGSAGRVLADAVASNRDYALNLGVFRMHHDGPSMDEGIVVARGSLGVRDPSAESERVCMEPLTCGGLHERTLAAAREQCARAAELPSCYLVRGAEDPCGR